MHSIYLGIRNIYYTESGNNWTNIVKLIRVAVIALIGKRYEGCESICFFCRWACPPGLWEYIHLSRFCVSISDSAFICHANYKITQGKNSAGIINWEICTVCWGGFVSSLLEKKMYSASSRSFCAHISILIKPHHSRLLQIALWCLVSLLPCHLFNVSLAGLMIQTSFVFAGFLQSIK